MKLVHAIKKSLKDLWTAKTIGIFFADTAFLFLFGLFSKPIYDKLIEHGIVLGHTMSSQKVGIFSSTAQPLLYKIAGLYVLWALAVFALYCLFQGTAWLLAKKITGKKEKLDYIKNFSNTTLPYYLVFCIIYLINTFTSIRHSILEKVAGQTLVNPYELLFWLTTGILILLAMNSYTTGSIKTIKTKWKQIILAAAFIIIILLNLNFLINSLFPGQENLYFTIPLVMLFLAWHRVFFIRMLS